MLEPQADGFNYLKAAYRPSAPEEMLVDARTAHGLSAPELTVLVGGLRVLGANHGSKGGRVHHTRQLTNDFFTVNLVGMSTAWRPSGDNVEGRDRKTGAVKRDGYPRRSAFAPTRNCVRHRRGTRKQTGRPNSSAATLLPRGPKVMSLTVSIGQVAS